MKIYQHKITKEFIQKNCKGDYSFQYGSHQGLPKRIIENSNDWELVSPKQNASN